MVFAPPARHLLRAKDLADARFYEPLAVDDLAHSLDEHALVVAGEQVVPAGAPHHLDDVPSGAPEHGFELLDNLTVAPDRTVQAL